MIKGFATRRSATPRGMLQRSEKKEKPWKREPISMMINMQNKWTNLYLGVIVNQILKQYYTAEPHDRLARLIKFFPRKKLSNFLCKSVHISHLNLWSRWNVSQNRFMGCLYWFSRLHKVTMFIIWLPPRAGKMGLSWPYNKSFIDQVCSFKMAGYWPRSFFLRFYGPRLRFGP